MHPFPIVACPINGESPPAPRPGALAQPMNPMIIRRQDEVREEQSHKHAVASVAIHPNAEVREPSEGATACRADGLPQGRHRHCNLSGTGSVTAAYFSLIDYRLHNPAFAWHLIISLRDPRRPVVQPFGVHKELVRFRHQRAGRLPGSELGLPRTRGSAAGPDRPRPHPAIRQLACTVGLASSP
jgi:hypothetical protein